MGGCHAGSQRRLAGVGGARRCARRSVSVENVESQIAEWRRFVADAPAVNGHDVDELEDHLRHQIAELNAAGLADDEAFLVAVKRMGDLDTLSREFAREHSDRLWKQLVVGPSGSAELQAAARTDAIVA